MPRHRSHNHDHAHVSYAGTARAGRAAASAAPVATGAAETVLFTSLLAKAEELCTHLIIAFAAVAIGAARLAASSPAHQAAVAHGSHGKAR